MKGNAFAAATVLGDTPPLRTMPMPDVKETGLPEAPHTAIDPVDAEHAVNNNAAAKRQRIEDTAVDASDLGKAEKQPS
jgi:hypothetical protein